MNAAQNSRLTIIIFNAQTSRRVRNLERCRDQISAIGSHCKEINIVIGLHKDEMLSDEEYDDGPTGTDVLEVWFAGCHSGNSAYLNVIYLILTSFCRYWWGISPEWHSE